MLEKSTSERQSTRYGNGMSDSVTVTVENIDLSSEIQQEMLVQTSSDSSISNALAQCTTVQTKPGTQSLAFTNF